MNKKTKIIIISTTIILFILILIINLIQNPEKQIIKYLENLDFINKENTNLYIKQISESTLEEHNKNKNNNVNSKYEILYFNRDTFELTKNKITYQDEINKDLTSIFDYKENKLIYTYRINYNDTNVIMEGSYNIENNIFTCKPTFSYQIDIEKSKKDICNKIKLDIELFSYEAQTLIEDPELLDYMKK